MARYTPQPYGYARPEVVPRALAEQIAAERDAYADQLDRLRRDLHALRRTLSAREDERAQLLQAVRALQDRLRIEEGAGPRVDPEQAGRTRRLLADLEQARAAGATAEAERDAALAERDATRAALDRAEAQLAELRGAQPEHARVQRLAADLANVRRRQEESIAAGVRAERIRWVGRVGEVRDAVQRALEASPDPKSPWHAGLTTLLAQVDGVLRAEGVRLVGAPGDPFDPAQHEALGLDPPDGFGPGTVTRVARVGLELDDGTLARPAQVFTTAS